MSAVLLDGRATAAVIREEIAAEVKRMDRPPGLATLLVGDDPGSQSYVGGKHRACEEVGFFSLDRRLPASASQSDVMAEITALNATTDVDAFIVQLPLPLGLDEGAALEGVDAAKDADGLHPVNLGRLVLGAPTVAPCTPAGIVELGERFGIEWAGSRVVIVGRGTTAGRPLGLLLTLKGVDATVTSCHSRTRDLASHTRDADVVVMAAGSPHLLAADMVRPGAAVFDVGISRTEEGRFGDVHPDVAGVAGWLAPTIGGVGPMTVAMLLRNTLRAAQHR